MLDLNTLICSALDLESMDIETSHTKDKAPNAVLIKTNLFASNLRSIVY